MAGELKIAEEYFFELSYAFGADETGIDGPVKGHYYATPPFGNPPFEGAAEYQDLEITLPGVDGIGVKRLGFRGRPIYARLAFIGDTKAEVETDKNAMFAKFVALASYSIQLPGGTTRPSCRIVHGSAGRGEWQYMGGKFCLFVDVQFKQCRLT
jgi:hypothetical protein